MLEAWKQRARAIRRDTHALYLARRDPRIPWYAKVLAALVVGYALSPVDLIPDFIPVLGYLDDLVILPLGILLVVRLIPADVLHEWRESSSAEGRPASHSLLAGAIIVLIWLAASGLVGWLLYAHVAGRHPQAQD